MGVKVGVQILKFMIIATKMCYRSVCNHPFVVGVLLLLLFLYRSFPWMFSILVSSSPVLVCTAVLLGALLSFGEPSIVSESDEGEKPCREGEIVESKTGSFENENPSVVMEDKCFGKDNRYTELRREYVKGVDEEPLLEKCDKLDDSELDQDDNDIASGLISTDYNSTEVEKQGVDEAQNEPEHIKTERTLDLGELMFRMGVGVDFRHGETPQSGIAEGEKVQAEHLEDYISAEGSIDFQMRDNLVVYSLESQKPSDEVLADSSLSAREVQYENFEDYKSADGSVDAHMKDQFEPSLASWKQFDILEDRLSTDQEAQEERLLGYNLGEGSSEAQMRDYLESSLRSWKQMGSDHDEDAESDSGSDGAESSSPDASMADIIPMLDELHPLLDDENPQANKLSRQSSAATMEHSAISPDSSIHSDDESDQKDEEADDGKSDVDDDNEEETQGGQKDSGKSVIMWTEDDQKNLMDLGTSELERNQRLESLIARRRARKLAGDRNLVDLDGTDLHFPVAPISTKRQNPFDFPQDSYADLGLPPIPGSAPSVMLSRRNPFDLPYDSSEEKPDLMGDSFQQEFMELTQREPFNQREALFRRNETFNLGSSGFDFGRPSRFRPYFVPERTDSDIMSYSSLQRQLSELSESKASSAAETESTYVGADQEEKKPIDHYSSQEVENSETDNASLLVEYGSQSFEDLESLSGEEKENKGYRFRELEVELGSVRSSRAADSDVMSNSSFQRHLSEHSESQELSASERESTYLGAEQEEKQVTEHNSVQEVEPSSEINYVALVEHGSQSSEDSESLSDEEKDKRDFVLSVLEVELGRAKSSATSASFTSETATSAQDAVEPWLSHRKVSHSDIPTMTESITVNHDTSAPNIVSDERMQDVDGCVLNKEKCQVNNLVDVDIPVKYSQETSVSDATTCLSLATSENRAEAEVDDSHPKEPIYDFSPLKQNRSLSSSSSDLQRETSGLDIYNLSRDLFVDELNVHNQESENFSPQTNQDADSNWLTMKEIGEGSGLDRNDFFKELNQVDDNGHLSMASSDKELMDKVPDQKVSPHDAEHIFAKEDVADIHFDNRNLNDMPSASGQEFAEDSVIDQEKNELAALGDNRSSVHSVSSSSQAQLEDKIEAEMKANQQVQVFTSSLNSHDNDGYETLKYSVDENQYRPCRTDIHDPLADLAEQEQSIIQRKVEEFDQVNEVDESMNVLTVQDPRLETLSSPGQSNESSCQAEDSETNSIKENLQDILETRHACIVEENDEMFEGFEGSIADDHHSNEEKNDIKEMDEALLSELDAVGDFRVSDIAPNLENSTINPHAATMDEVYTGTEIPDGHNTFFVESSPVGNFESEETITGNNHPRTKESNLDSHTRYMSTDLENMEAHSVEVFDYVFKMVNEEIQNSVFADTFMSEFTTKEVDVLHPKTESFAEDKGPRSCSSEATLDADVVFNTSESVTNHNQADLAIPELLNLDSDKKATVSEMLVLDAKIVEQSGDDIEKVETKVEKSRIVEAQEIVAETGDDSMETLPLQIERVINQIEQSPLNEASTASVLELSDQVVTVGSIEFEPLLIDRNVQKMHESSVHDGNDLLALESEDGKETPTMSVVGANVASAVEPGNQIERNTFEELALGKDSKKIQESHLVGVSIDSAVNSEHQVENFDSTRSELQIEEEVDETQEFPSHEGSIAAASGSGVHMEKVESSELLQFDKNIHDIQDSPDIKLSNPLALKPEDNEEMVGYIESEPLQSYRDVEELQDWHVVDETAPIDLELLQTDTDITEIQKIPTADATIPVSKSKDQLLTAVAGEPGQFLMDSNVGNFQKLPAFEAKLAPAVESEGQLERVGSSEPETLQMDEALKKTQESSVKTSFASADEFRDELQIDSQIDVVEVQGSQDLKLLSKQQPEVDVPNAGDSRGFHVDSIND